MLKKKTAPSQQLAQTWTAIMYSKIINFHIRKDKSRETCVCKWTQIWSIMENMKGFNHCVTQNAHEYLQGHNIYSLTPL